MLLAHVVVLCAAVLSEPHHNVSRHVIDAAASNAMAHAAGAKTVGKAAAAAFPGSKAEVHEKAAANGRAQGSAMGKATGYGDSTIHVNPNRHRSPRAPSEPPRPPHAHPPHIPGWRSHARQHSAELATVNAAKAQQPAKVVRKGGSLENALGHRPAAGDGHGHRGMRPPSLPPRPARPPRPPHVPGWHVHGRHSDAATVPGGKAGPKAKRAPAQHAGQLGTAGTGALLAVFVVCIGILFMIEDCLLRRRPGHLADPTPHPIRP